MDLTIVIQGRLSNESLEFYLKNYKNFPVIISTYFGLKKYKGKLPSNFKLIQIDEPYSENESNLVYQIETTFAGLKEVKTKYCIKIRGDEYYSNIEDIYNLILKNENKIFTSPIAFRKPHEYSFHISDHLIAGKTENLIKMFSFEKFKSNIPEQNLAINYLEKTLPDYENKPIASMVEKFDIIDLNKHKPYKMVSFSEKREWYDSFNAIEYNSISKMEDYKTRIAVCLSGQSRTWKFCLESIKNFLEKDNEYEIDYFIHTWDKNDSREIHIGDGKQLKINTEIGSIQDYIKSYNPKLYKIDSFESYKKNKFSKWKPLLDYQRWEPENTLHLMYSFYKSVTLKKIWERKNGFIYDYVIKLRPDVFFEEQKLENHLELLKNKEDKYFISHYPYYEKWKEYNEERPDFFGSDLYWIFQKNEIDKFSEFFNSKIAHDKFHNYPLTQYLYTNFKRFEPVNVFKNSSWLENPFYIIREWHECIFNIFPNLQNDFKTNFYIISIFFEIYLVDEVTFNYLKKNQLNTIKSIVEDKEIFNKLNSHTFEQFIQSHPKIIKIIDNFINKMNEFLKEKKEDENSRIL